MLLLIIRGIRLIYNALLMSQIHSQLKVPAEVLRTKNDKDYSFTLMIRTDSQGRITSVELGFK